ncbi:MAG: beta-lactamase family protein [Bacillus sp. (in: Bacteria)]|nr:beta-lactamase family protein [Bacillus sp. (in: firmicutes)]
MLYQKNFGYANLEQQVPITDNTVFHVASVSKQVTVMSILLLQEDGKLNIDDDVQEYVPELIQFNEAVTIRQLMNNVSGIRDQWELLGLSGVRIVDTITQRDALSIIEKQQQLNFSPQSQFLYSNSNFTLLAEIVERLTGKTFNQFTQERIFKPLGMTQTCFKDSYWEVIPYRADSYYDTGTGKYVASVLNYGSYGATSLNTTVRDFLKWMDNYKTPVLCSEETLQIMWETRPLLDGTRNNYAGGLFVGEHRGRNYFEHGGADAGFRSAMIRFPDEDVDIVLFSNTQNMLMKDTAFAVANAVFGEVPEEKTKETEYELDPYKGELDLTSVEGVYFPVTETPFMRLDLMVVDGVLHFKHPYGTAPLKHINGNHYRINSLGIELYLGKNIIMKWNGKLVEMKS